MRSETRRVKFRFQEIMEREAVLIPEICMEIGSAVGVNVSRYRQLTDIFFHRESVADNWHVRQFSVLSGRANIFPIEAVADGWSRRAKASSPSRSRVGWFVFDLTFPFYLPDTLRLDIMRQTFDWSRKISGRDVRHFVGGMANTIFEWHDY